MTTLNEEFAAAREKGEEHVSALETNYLSAIRGAGRTAAQRFSERATTLRAAANWQPPDVGDVMAFAVNTDRIRGAQREMLGAIGGRLTDIPGVAFDTLAPPSQKQLDKLGLRAAAMSQDLRTPVAAAIAEGWARGYSVPQTASLIQNAVNGLAPGRATMLARTDLISLSNGANQNVVGILNEAAKEAGDPAVISSKTWLSSQDGRVRTTHQDADGQTVPVDQPYSVGGFDLMYPGDPDGPDEEVINCRCTELYSEEAATSATTAEIPEEAAAPEALAARIGTPDFNSANNVGWQVQGEFNAVMERLTSVPLNAAMREKLASSPGGKLPIHVGVEKGSDLDKISPASQGFFKRKKSATGRAFEQDPDFIAIKRDALDPIGTFLHEYGHFLDNAGFGARKYASINPRTTAQARLMDALHNSKEMKGLKARLDELKAKSAQEGGLIPIHEFQTMQHIEYLLKNEEMFARAFYQYAVSRYGGQFMRRSLEARLLREQDPYAFTSHWSSDDWAVIERLMDEVLREARLIPDEAVVAGLVREVIDVWLLPGVESREPVARLLHGEVEAGQPLDDLLVGESGGPRSGNVEHGSKDTLELTTKEETMAAVETEAPVATRWISDVAFEGVSTGDGRYMAPGSIGWRDLPLTLMAMIETPEFGGHSGAQVAGRIDTMVKDEEHYMDGEALPEGVTAIRSTGEFDIEGDRGGETARMVGDETMRGISMDLAVHEWALRDPDTGDLIDPDSASDDDWERAFMGELEFAVISGEIMAATVCPTPAFAEARIAILASGRVKQHVWKANAYAAFVLGVKEGQMMTTLTASVEPLRKPLKSDGNGAVPFNADLWNTVASASSGGMSASVRHATARKSVAPLAPPSAWLHRPEPKEPTPFTILDSGECYGHLALWETCHTGYLNGEFAQCVRAPHSITSYGQFHVGELRCDEGDLLPIGKITYDTGHADLGRSRAAARCHYDDTGAVGAFVRARDGQFGIWVSGALRSDLAPEGVRDIRANPLSGDWRDFERNLELIAALAVPVPGFPIARSQLALSASVEGDVRITALILTGLGMTASVGNGHAPEHEGAALDAIIAGGAAGLAELIG